MADVFISYSVKDKDISEFMYKHLTNEGLDVFMAPLSVNPGERWDKKILKNLKMSPWVLFLASKDACASAVIQQEIGIALGTQKNLVPIVWNMDPSQLPGFVSNIQALDLRNATLTDAQEQIVKIANRIKANKSNGILIAALFLGALLFVTCKK